MAAVKLDGVSSGQRQHVEEAVPTNLDDLTLVQYGSCCAITVRSYNLSASSTSLQHAIYAVAAVLDTNHGSSSQLLPATNTGAAAVAIGHAAPDQATRAHDAD